MSLPLSPLTYDILAQIVSWAPRDALTTLCLVARDFHHLAAPRLYRVADFADDEPDAALQFLEVIASSPNLGSFVCWLSIIDVDVYVLPVFLPALRNMPNLQHFCCKRLGAIAMHVPAVLDAIVNLPALRSLDITHSEKYDFNAFIDRLPPLQRLTVSVYSDGADAVKRLLLRSRDTLRFLDTSHSDFLEFFLQSQTGAVWPRTTELRLYELDAAAQVVQAFPNVEVLHISVLPPSLEAEHILGDPAVLPRLRQLSILVHDTDKAENGNRAVRRRLSHLFVDMYWDSFGHTSAGLFELMSAFSWEHLQSLQLRADDTSKLDRVLENLPALLAGCRQLAFFAMCITYWNPSRGANPLFRILDTLHGMPDSVKLPRLRYILLSVNWKLKNAAKAASVTGAVESKLDLLFSRAPELHIFQCHLTEREMSWARRSCLGGERQVDKLPIGLTNVVRFLEGEIEW